MSCYSVLLIVVALIAALFIGIKMYFGWPTRWCRSQRCLVGKTAIITGANTGIGFETALDFAKRGAKVILACRDRARAEEARRKIIEETDNPKIFVKIVDFTSFDSIRAFAKEINESEERLDILANNVGISFGDDVKTEDGCDIVMQVNYYSHYLLTHLLIGLMMKSGDPSRIVNTSSLAAAHANNFDVNNLQKFPGNMAAYANSKLCNILFTKVLARKLQDTNITVYSLHPGTIKTDIFRLAKGFAKVALQIVVALFYKPVEEGAQTNIYCSVQKGIERFSGCHFDNCRKVEDYRTTRVPHLAEKLWELTEPIVHLQEAEKIAF